jgi:CRP/FNR family transcriptional regulator, cyclic AMP receptor protein
MTDHQGRFMTAAGRDLIRAIHVAGRERGFARGEQIQPAGKSHPDESILVIESGFVSTVATAPSRRRMLLSIHGPGDLAGERVLFGNQAHGLVITGMTQGSAWSVRPDRFRQILRHYPGGWEILARHQDNRLVAAQERIWLMASDTAGRRLAVFLLQLLSYNEPQQARHDQAQRVPLQLSQTELAEWIGASRETVERVLSGWGRRGIVQTGRRHLLVKDVAMLEKIVGHRRDTARAA